MNVRELLLAVKCLRQFEQFVNGFLCFLFLQPPFYFYYCKKKTNLSFFLLKIKLRYELIAANL